MATVEIKDNTKEVLDPVIRGLDKTDLERL